MTLGTSGLLRALFEMCIDILGPHTACMHCYCTGTSPSLSLSSLLDYTDSTVALACRPVIDNLSVASLVDKCAFFPLSDISITYLSLSTIPAIYTTIPKDYSADRKSKHPPFILASYGAEYYHHSFSTIKANTQHLF